MTSLETLPCEIKDQICSHLCQMDLYNFLPISPELSESATTSLYRSPIFRSSYRFAQFVTKVSHSRRFADMVRRLIVWDEIEEENNLCNFARWIEWTYRNQPVYATGDPPPAKLYETYRGLCWDKHPTRSKFLRGDYAFVPIGLIIQALSSCRNLRSGLCPLERRDAHAEQGRRVKDQMSLQRFPPQVALPSTDSDIRQAISFRTPEVVVTQRP